MMTGRIGLTLAVMAALLAPAQAKSADTHTESHAKSRTKVTVRPHWHGYGFLPGYHQPPGLSDWHDRAGRHGDISGRYERRYLNLWTGQWNYGWGRPGFYHGQWNGGGFGPCWTWTPIGMMPTCGQ